ncbi:MAG: hypothetical protein H0W63_10470 [Gemmatimonadaceae bacterium]|nr:hypothetical protein [Gemmatimonadaceae bacterium]
MIPRSLLLLFAFFAPASASVPPSPSPKLPGQILDVTMDNYFFRAPATARPGLTTIRVHSPHDGHQLDVYRLDDGHSVSDLVNALASNAPTPWAKEMGGVGFPLKGGTVNATYIFEAGQYAFICAVHVPMTNKRHYQLGMYTEVKVSGLRVPGSLPTPDISVSETEYRWSFSKPITAGVHVLRVTNDGKAFHEMKILQMLPGHTVAEARAWKRGQPRVDVPYATVTVMAPGTSVLTTTDFPPGEYLLFCVPQVKHGMSQPLIVAKR